MTNHDATSWLQSKSLPYIGLGIGILALGMSAIFVRWADAPGPVTGFYRLFLSTIFLTPFFIRRSSHNKSSLNKKTIIFPFLGGILLALDLAFWSTSVFYTSAANSTLLGNTAPLWVSLGAWLIFREKLTGNFWFGLALAMAGAVLIVGSDFFIHPRLGIGDLMAAAAGVFYGGYYLATQRGRQHFDSISYVWLMGVIASVSLALINLGLGHSLGGYSKETWLVFGATALVSQIIGYISISFAMGHLPASVVAPTMVGQPIMTTILAIPLLGEIPRPIQLLGGAIALTGIFLVNRAYHQKSDKPDHRTD
ncbi:MAG: DMT family transporter [Anaerolineales bacterium]|uniref:DMT family transporter n=1 Tax=Candidatus Desulfolinea nitratireducens TaxID=2841698 RepID=A0A8J6TJV8_9CHLR|nr:DMT family transporter [Candidatus Desulfolinea nitratireducens]MBL6961556.1 DMT family transporter [Anaerolineales bacterium]